MSQGKRSSNDISRRDFIRLSSGLLTVSGAAGLIGCGGGGGGAGPASTGGGSTTSGTVSDAARFAVFAGAEQLTNSLTHADLAKDALTIQTYLQSQPTINATIITSDNNVWAHFTDGVIYGVYNNSVVAVPPGKSAVMRPGTSTGRAAELPSVPTANLFFSVGQGLLPTGDTVAPWLKSAGYSPIVNDIAGVEDFKTVGKTTGIFYISAHGGLLPTNVVDDSKAAMIPRGRGVAKTRSLVFNPSGPVSYGLSTSTAVTQANLTTYRPLWQSGLLLVGTASTGVAKAGSTVIESSTVWCITEKFVEQYMSFGENSLVFIDACTSFNDVIRQACFSKGASLYVGWSGSINYLVSDKIATTLFDEMLGANQVVKLTPPQRPFDFPSIYENMVSTGMYKSDPSFPDTELQYEANPAAGEGDFAILSPSISNLVVSGTSAAPFLAIRGDFGTEPQVGGTVTIYPGGAPAPGTGGTGTALAIQNWQPTQIDCALPSTGGDVVVSALGYTSNPRRLTEWKGTLHYSGSGPENHLESFTLNLHILADIASFRIEVNEVLAGSNELLQASTFSTLPDSTCSFADSGEYTSSNKLSTTTWTGGGALSPGKNPGFTYYGTIDPVGLTMSLFYAVLTASDVEIQYKDSNGDDNGSGTGSLVMQTSDFPSNVADSYLSFALDSSLNIKGGSLSDSFESYISPDNVTTYTSLSWGMMAVTAGTAPVATAARSAKANG